MSNQNGAASAATVAAVTTRYFAGRYVDDLRDLYLAGLVSGLHSVAIGAPGWGKTDVGLSILDDVMPGRYAVIRIHPASQPEEIDGPHDMDVLLKDSKLVKHTDGTAYDPTMRAVLVDEIGRASRVLVGKLMFLLDRKDIKNPPPILATSNFMPDSVESEALLDRIALWHHITVAPVDVRAMVAAQMGATNGRLHVMGKLPDLATIEDVWAAVPGDKAIHAVSEVLDTLATDAGQEGLSVHPRRLWQWQRLLFRMSVYMTGDANFAAAPDKAVKFLRFAFPAKTSADAESWTQIVAAAGDPLGALIDATMGEAAAKLNDVAGADIRQRANWSAEVGTVIAKAQTQLAEFESQGRDPRIDDAKMLLNTWFIAAARGEKIDRG